MLRDLVQRVRGVLQSPRQTLPLTLAESGEPAAVFLPYVAILAALGPLALFLSDGAFGAWHAPTEIFNMVISVGWVRTPLPALVTSLLTYAVSVGAWIGLAAALVLLAPWFGGLRDRGGALKAAAYILTPVWIAGVSALFGSVPYFNWMPGVLLVAGIAWGAFVGVVAVPLHLGTPDPKAAGHAMAALGATATVATAAYFLLSWLVYKNWP